MKYRVASGGAPTDVEVDVADDGTLRLRGASGEHALVAGESHGGLWRVELDGRRLVVGLTRLGDGRYQVVVDGVSRCLTVTDPAARGFGHGGDEGTGGLVRAPIPGMVVGVHVEAGAQVAAGAPLVTLYAMKLENEIRAPFAGRVVEVGVESGRAVEKGELLVRLEA